MIRRFAAGSALLVIVLIFAGGILTRKAPGLLRSALSTALGKDVEIGDILYDFPDSFEVRGLKVKERGAFSGEVSFAAESVRLRILPAELLQRSLTVDSVVVEGPRITVWKGSDRIVHALSDAGTSMRLASAPSAGEGPGRAVVISELRIKHLRLEKASARWVDHSVPGSGFAADIDEMDLDLRGLSFPSSGEAILFELAGRLAQERGVAASAVHASGWVRPGPGDAEVHASARSLHLPFLAAYYGQVTSARIDEGYADVRMILRAQEGATRLNAGFEVTSLHFGGFEEQGALFGLKAEEILSSVKDPVSGKTRFQIDADWSAKAGERPSERIRQSLSRSLQASVLTDLSGLAKKAISHHAGSSSDDAPIPPAKEDKVKAVIEKVQDLLDR